MILEWLRIVVSMAFDWPFVLRGVYSGGAVDGVVIVIDIWSPSRICVMRDFSVSEIIAYRLVLCFFEFYVNRL